METKNAPKDLKYIINNISFFLETGFLKREGEGGSDNWEKFPENLVLLFGWRPLDARLLASKMRRNSTLGAGAQNLLGPPDRIPPGQRLLVDVIKAL